MQSCPGTGRRWCANLQQAGKDAQEIVHSLSIILKGAADEIEKPKEKK